MLEKHLGQSSSQRMVMENLVMTLVDERRGRDLGLGDVGESIWAPCDGPGENGRRASRLTRMFTVPDMFLMCRLCGASAAVRTSYGDW